MSEATEIRPSRRVQKIELFDGGVEVTLNDGVGIRITYDGGKITFTEDSIFNSDRGFREIDLPEVA